MQLLCGVLRFCEVISPRLGRGRKLSLPNLAYVRSENGIDLQQFALRSAAPTTVQIPCGQMEKELMTLDKTGTWPTFFKKMVSYFRVT